jgi:hypothetical protein
MAECMDRGLNVEEVMFQFELKNESKNDADRIAREDAGKLIEDRMEEYMERFRSAQ